MTDTSPETPPPPTSAPEETGGTVEPAHPFAKWGGDVPTRSGKEKKKAGGGIDAASFWTRFRHSTTCKLFFVAALALLLLIPLDRINALRKERAGLREEAVAEITNAWGGRQVVAGPVLVLPYTHTLSGATPAETGYAYFLPETLNIEGRIDPEVRYRGIYQAVLYRAELGLRARFAPPAAELAALGVDPARVDWDRAFVHVALSDLRGINENLVLRGQGREIPFVPGSTPSFPTPGLSARIGPFMAEVLKNPASPAPAAAETDGEGKEGGDGPLSFSFVLPVNGSGELDFAPLGKQNMVTVASPWKDPGFRGNILPEKRRIGADGFDAEWRATWYGRNLPQQWTSTNDQQLRQHLESTLFGVSLVFPVDHYRLVERALKYGFLFVALAFAAFFLFEILGSRRRSIHPLQYALIGGALCLFYMAILAFSEVLAFDLAYLIGAGAAVFLVAFYTAGFLDGWGGGLRAGGALALVYAFLYFVLKMQDWSLVAGTVGLFVALFILMAATRRIKTD